MKNSAIQKAIHHGSFSRIPLFSKMNILRIFKKVRKYFWLNKAEE